MTFALILAVLFICITILFMFNFHVVTICITILFMFLFILCFILLKVIILLSFWLCCLFVLFLIRCYSCFVVVFLCFPENEATNAASEVQPRVLGDATPQDVCSKTSLLLCCFVYYYYGQSAY